MYGSHKIKFDELNSEISDLKSELSVIKESNEKLAKKLRQSDSLLTEKVSIRLEASF